MGIKKILNSIRFEPRDGFQEELLTKLIRNKDASYSLGDSKKEEMHIGLQQPIYKKELLVIELAVATLVTIACSPFGIDAIRSWAEDFILR